MKYSRIFLFLFPALIFSSCKPSIPQEDFHPGEADMSKFIALGGDYMAGMQNGALWRKGQELSLPALIHKSLVYVGAGDFNQPLMPDDKGLGLNPKPWESVFVSASSLKFRTNCQGVSSLKPVKDTFGLVNAAPYLAGISGNSFQNLAVPHARIQDFFNPNLSQPYSPTNKNPFYYRFASNAGSSTVHTDAKNQNPTFFAAWLGMEEIYEFAKTGATNYAIPSFSTFEFYLRKFVGELTQQGAKGILGNIPEIYSLPFFTTIPWNGLELSAHKADSLNQLTGFMFNFQEGKNGFVIKDPLQPGNFRKMKPGEYILLTIPVDSVKCNFLGVFTPVPDQYVLDEVEVVAINTSIWWYNQMIERVARDYNLALADMNSYFRNLNSGITWDGVGFNTGFVSGGFFSLDGYRPNQKGYSLLANAWISAINSHYKARIPKHYCSSCDGIKFP